MFLKQSKKFRKKIKIIYAGELYVSNDDEIIETLLGSCVAVCLYDPERKISGMNHFMLPGRISKSDIFVDRSARYGISAIDELIKQLEELGALRENLIAKLFGGGHVLSNGCDSVDIPFENIRLAKVILELEDISIEEIDVGDKYTRKVLMDVKTGKVYLKKTTDERVYSEFTKGIKSKS